MGISMGLSRRVYIALFAILAELVVIAATGNQGVTNFVNDNMAKSPLGDQFLQSVPSYPWRITPKSGSGGSTILVSQYAAIATLLVLTFVLVLIVVRGAGGFSGPFFATILVVLGSSIVAHMVANVVAFDQIGRAEHSGLGRVGYSLFNSNDGQTIMFALMCGVVVAVVTGIVGLVIRRRARAQAAIAAAAAEAAAAQARGDQAMVNEFFAPTGAGGGPMPVAAVPAGPAPWGSYETTVPDSTAVYGAPDTSVYAPTESYPACCADRVGLCRTGGRIRLCRHLESAMPHRRPTRAMPHRRPIRLRRRRLYAAPESIAHDESEAQAAAPESAPLPEHSEAEPHQASDETPAEVPVHEENPHSSIPNE